MNEGNEKFEVEEDENKGEKMKWIQGEIIILIFA